MIVRLWPGSPVDAAALGCLLPHATRRLMLPTRDAFGEGASRPSASLRPSEVPACTIRAGQARAGPTTPPTLAWYLASVPRPGLEALVLPGGAGPGCAALPAVWFLRVAPVLYFAPGWSFAGPWCLRLGPAPLVPCRPPGAQVGRRQFALIGLFRARLPCPCFGRLRPLLPRSGRPPWPPPPRCLPRFGPGGGGLGGGPGVGGAFPAAVRPGLRPSVRPRGPRPCRAVVRSPFAPCRVWASSTWFLSAVLSSSRSSRDRRVRSSVLRLRPYRSCQKRHTRRNYTQAATTQQCCTPHRDTPPKAAIENTTPRAQRAQGVFARTNATKPMLFCCVHPVRIKRPA